MVVASHLLIPVQMEGLSVNDLAAILGALNEVKNGRFALNKDLELLGLLPVMLDERPRIVRQALGFLKIYMVIRSCRMVFDVASR